MKMLIVAMSAFALAGCAETLEGAGAVNRGPERSARHVPTEREKRILVLESENAGQPTEVLGVVDVHEPVASHDEALDELREHAAELGADAVLGVEFHHGEAGPAPTHLSGLAVRFRDLLHGRAYDVIKHLEVHVPMGHEEEAQRRLGEEANAVHADLILNIKFEHGEGEGPLTMTGNAIRIRP